MSTDYWSTFRGSLRYDPLKIPGGVNAAEIPSNTRTEIFAPKRLNPAQVSIQPQDTVYQAQDSFGLAQLLSLTPLGGVVEKLGRALGIKTAESKNVPPIEIIPSHDREIIYTPKQPYDDLFDPKDSVYTPNETPYSNKDNSRKAPATLKKISIKSKITK